VYHAVVGGATSDQQTVTSLSAMRSQSAGPLGQEAVDPMRHLTPHLKRAFQVYKKLENLQASAEGANTTLERLEIAVIELSGDGSVAGMNRRAEALIQRNDCLTLSQGRLAATNSSDAEQLEKLTRAAALTGAGLGSSTGGAMLLHRSGHLEPLTVTVMPFHSSHVLTESHPCALVLIGDPAERPASRAGLLSVLYRLTPAECRLADLLLEELDLRRVAERMRITVGTARFMVKSIFAKTGTHRQSQPVRLLMSLPGETQRRFHRRLLPK